MRWPFQSIAQLLDGLEPLLAVDRGVGREEDRRRGLDAAVDLGLSEVVEVALVAQFLDDQQCLLSRVNIP
jgi:hypothetical protein